MKTFILAAALTVAALVGIAQASNCTQTCTPDGAGGFRCTTFCW